MTWVRTEDGTPNHPKHLRAGAEACWLWQCGLCYSNAHKLDGRLGKDVLPALYAPLATKAKRLAAKLCLVGLWHDRGDHYEIHDYAHYQEQALKEAVESRREYERERKREQRSGTKHAKSPGQVRDNVPAPAGAVPSVTRASPDPTRPDPSRPENTDTERARAAAPSPESPAADATPAYDHLAEGERTSFATKVWTKFRNLHLKRFELDPSMGGKNVGDFPERLAATAKARGVEASVLLEQTFGLWAAAGRPGCDKATPYSAFVARFDSLVAPGKQTGGRLGYMQAAGEEKFANVDPAENLRKCGLSEEEIAKALEELGHGQKPAQAPAGGPAPANTNNGAPTRSAAREGRLAPEGHR